MIASLIITASLVLRSLSEISGLSDAELAKSPEFELSGTVTDVDVHSDFAFTDGLRRAFVYRGEADLPRPGDNVIIQGRATVDKDRYRLLRASKITVTSRDTPPPPVTATLAKVTSGALDYHTARIKGRITDIHSDELSRDCQLLTMTDGHEMAIVPVFTNASPTAYLNAEVAVTGIVRPIYRGTRIFSTYLIGQSRGSSIEILTLPPKDKFSVQELGDIHHVTPQRLSQLGYRRVTGRVCATLSQLGYRRVTGRVCATWDGCHILIRTAGTSNLPIHVILQKGLALPAYEDTVDAVGFVGTDLFNILLTDAEWRPSTQSPRPPASRDEPVIRTSVKAITRTNDPAARGAAGLPIGKAVEVTGTVRRIAEDESALVLDDGAAVIEIDASMAPDALSSLQPQSEIRVRGIYQLLAERWQPSPKFPNVYGAQIILRRAEDLEVLSRPPWWTPRMLIAVIFSLMILAIGTFIWNRILNRIVDRRTHALLKERLAHDEAELKKEERTKLAVELHDSLSQNLTGIAFQLDVAELTAESRPQDVLPILRQIRLKMQSCRDNLKNCLWDLRNLAIDQALLRDSLRETLAPVIGTAHVAIDFPVRNSNLDESIVHAVICIVRELAVNAVRHGKASRIDISGRRDADGIRLTVKDNGSGFDPENRPGTDEGHFGLQGVAERVARLNGEMTVTSSPGQGTEVFIRGLHEKG